MLTKTDNLVSRIRECCIVRGVDVLPQGHVRIETAFLYPDGSSIDVFVVHDEGRSPMSPPKISDLGQTAELLLNHGVKPWANTTLEDVLPLYGVELIGGALEKTIGWPEESLERAIILLGQACIRMSGQATLALPPAPTTEGNMTDQVTDQAPQQDPPLSMRRFLAFLKAHRPSLTENGLIRSCRLWRAGNMSA